MNTIREKRIQYGMPPTIRLQCSPSILARGQAAILTMQVEESTGYNSPITIELISESDNLVLRSWEMTDYTQALQIDIPEEFPETEFELVAKCQNWILDSIPFEVASPEAVEVVNNYSSALHASVQALEVIKAGDFEKAISLLQTAGVDYEAADAPEIAASSWKDGGEAFFHAGAADFALESFKHAYNYYQEADDEFGAEYAQKVIERLEMEHGMPQEPIV